MNDIVSPARAPSLAQIIAQQITTEGPLPLADYMALSLNHPTLGYYRKQDPLGAAGDFTTAPEISQMFGELVGMCLLDVWSRAGMPKFTLAEIGPGRGSLMADVWRASNILPPFQVAADTHLIETSPALRAEQKKRVPHATWHERLEDLPTDKPLYLIANELFDALPIRQFERLSNNWFERYVRLSEKSTAEAPLFEACLVPLAPGAEDLLPPSMQTAPDGSIVEHCPSGLALIEELSHRLAKQGGMALIIDYGFDGPAGGDTFQALRSHKFADPFIEPGSADLTAHVNFLTLKNAASRAGVQALGSIEQGAFLRNLGIEARAQTLIAKASPSQQSDVVSALHRLTDDKEMGSLFKVLALVGANTPTPVGF
ncbi:MAG: SAM-dependent methyltransferase [Parvibaculaceae bacterium]|nr:SAM-dependent methyltransferase [Parvibaculaceae bacterium]